MVNLRLTVHASLGLVILLLHRQQRSSSDGISSVRKASAQTAQQIFLACLKEKGTQTGHVQRIPGRWPPKWRLLSCNRHFYRSAYLAGKKKQQCHILREGVIVLQNTWHCSTKHTRNIRERTQERRIFSQRVSAYKETWLWSDQIHRHLETEILQQISRKKYNKIK